MWTIRQIRRLVGPEMIEDHPRNRRNLPKDRPAMALVVRRLRRVTNASIWKKLVFCVYARSGRERMLCEDIIIRKKCEGGY